MKIRIGKEFNTQSLDPQDLESLKDITPLPLKEAWTIRVDLISKANRLNKLGKQRVLQGERFHEKAMRLRVEAALLWEASVLNEKGNVEMVWGDGFCRLPTGETFQKGD